jgi:phosphatidylglycerol---prolipoprotein diacylglyceryl transferase
MLIGIDPVVLSLGPLAVRWFGLLALVGLGVAIWGSQREVDRQRLGRRLALDALAWGLPAGLLVARLVHVLGYWDFYLTNASELQQLNIDGLSLWGGLVGGGLVAAARLRRDPTRRRRILDVIVPYAALGIAIGRLGEFLDGHGQGLASTLPWATQYSNPLAATPDFGVARHPAQLYDALSALALAVILWAVPRAAPAGTRTAVFLVGYGATRFALGAVRLDPTFLFSLQIEQLLALGAVLFGVVFALGPLAQQHVAARSRERDRHAEHQAVRKEDSLAA